MDLDIRTMSVGTLRLYVDRVLQAPSFAQTLRAQNIEIARTASPKQTETTQRWKLTLRLIENGTEVPTKIEFSRRALDEAVHEAVDADVIRAYRLYPVIVQHYSADVAFAQKVLALALRAQVQSRDIFDLKLLLDVGAGKAPLPRKVLSELPKAIDHAMEVSYKDFAGQVLAYLEPEYQAHYRDRDTWSALQEQVVDALEGLAP
jgi:predicted nucleotidyltransferase component of viral defense system